MLLFAAAPVFCTNTHQSPDGTLAAPEWLAACRSCAAVRTAALHCADAAATLSFDHRTQQQQITAAPPRGHPSATAAAAAAARHAQQHSSQLKKRPRQQQQPASPGRKGGGSKAGGAGAAAAAAAAEHWLKSRKASHLLDNKLYATVYWYIRASTGGSSRH
jgi:hypothetical protein